MTTENPRQLGFAFPDLDLIEPEIAKPTRFENLLDRLYDYDPEVDCSDVFILKSGQQRAAGIYENLHYNSDDVDEEYFTIYKEEANGMLSQDALYVFRSGERDDKGDLNHIPLSFRIVENPQDMKFPEDDDSLSGYEVFPKLEVYAEYPYRNITAAEALEFVKGIILADPKKIVFID